MMADNLGGLFDSDPGFLEELASGAGEQKSTGNQKQTFYSFDVDLCF